jgi:uncharacterized protein
VRRVVGRFAAAVVVAGVRCYQLAVRPLLPAVCRFTPSCSEYMIEAVRKYGPVRGVGKGLARVARCNPWNLGGYDPP